MFLVANSSTSPKNAEDNISPEALTSKSMSPPQPNSHMPLYTGHPTQLTTSPFTILNTTSQGLVCDQSHTTSQSVTIDPRSNPVLSQLNHVTSQYGTSNQNCTTPIWAGNGIMSTGTNYNMEVHHNNNQVSGMNQPNTFCYTGYGSLKSTNPRTQPWYGGEKNYHYQNHYNTASKPVYHSSVQPYFTNLIQNHHQTLPYHHLTYQPPSYQVPNFPPITCRLPTQMTPTNLTATSQSYLSLPSIQVNSDPSIPHQAQPITLSTTQPTIQPTIQPTTQPAITQPYFYNQPFLQSDVAINYLDTLAGLFTQSIAPFNDHQTNKKPPTFEAAPPSGQHFLPSCFYDYSGKNLCHFSDTNAPPSCHLNETPNSDLKNKQDLPANSTGYTRITLGCGINPRGLCYIPKEPLSSCMYVSSPHVAKANDEEVSKNKQNIKALSEVDVVGLDVSEDKVKTEKLKKDNKHERTTAQRNWVCNVCCKILARKSTLKIHMRQHTGDRPFTCPTCKKSFAQAGLLHSHQRIHTGERPYLCTHCPKSFAHSGALRTHLNTHTGERPHHCPIPGCGQAFGDSSTLSKHRRTHTGERPYVCVTCGKRFTQSGNMHKHRKTVHHIVNTSPEKESVI